MHAKKVRNFIAMLQAQFQVHCIAAVYYSHACITAVPVILLIVFYK